MSILKELKSSSTYKKYLKILEHAQSKIDYDRDRLEALSLHSSLLVRTIYGRKKYSPKAMIEAAAQVQSNRSRLVELRVRVSIQLSEVEEAAKAFRGFAYTKYVEELKAYKTKDQRMALLDRATSASADFLAEGKTFLSIMDDLIKDLDQSSHSLRHMLDALKLMAGAKTANTI